MGRAMTAVQGRSLRRDRAQDAAKGGAERLGAFDALRGAAMLLVVVAHAALAYLDVRVPRLLWAVRDVSRSPAYDALFWVCVGVAMPAFFTMSGFLAVRIHEARGAAGFARDRMRRIVVPFFAAGVTILPLSLAVWALGWLNVGRATWLQVRHFKYIDRVIGTNLSGPAHLWYLEYLILMLIVFGLVRGRGGRASSRPSRGWLLHPLAPLVLAIPSALILWTGHQRFGLDAVADMRNSFIPDPFRWVHHAWFFVIGTWLYRDRDQLARLVPHASWRLVFAAATFVVRFRLLERDLAVPVEGAASVALAVSGALYGWLSLFGLLGLFQRLFNRSRPAIRYLADSSYWIYLVHFPLLGLVQVDLARLPGPAAWKFAVVLGVTLAIGLASYHVLVRGTWVGRWILGARPAAQPRAQTTRPAARSTAVS